MSSGRPSYEQLAALVVEQAATIERLEAEVVEFRAELAELRRRLAQNSRNSRVGSIELAVPKLRRIERRGHRMVTFERLGRAPENTTTSRVYTHVLADETEIDYGALVGS